MIDKLNIHSWLEYALKDGLETKDLASNSKVYQNYCKERDEIEKHKQSKKLTTSAGERFVSDVLGSLVLASPASVGSHSLHINRWITILLLNAPGPNVSDSICVIS